MFSRVFRQPFYLGIDVTDTGIFLAVMTRQINGQLTLVQQEKIERMPPCSWNNFSEIPALLQPYTHPFQHSQTGLCLPETLVEHHNLVLEKNIPDHELEETIRFTLYGELKHDTHFLDFKRIEWQENTAEQKFLILAVDRQILTPYLNLLATLSLSLNALIVMPFEQDSPFQRAIEAAQWAAL